MNTANEPASIADNLCSMDSGIAKKKRKLTNQQRALVKHLIRGMSITDAARAAGYSEKWPAQAGWQALEAVRNKMPELLERHGLSDDALIENYLKPALQATETKLAQHEGRFTDEREVIVWGPRLTALDMTLNLKGSYTQKDKNSAVVVPVQFVTNVEWPDP